MGEGCCEQKQMQIPSGNDNQKVASQPKSLACDYDGAGLRPFCRSGSLNFV